MMLGLGASYYSVPTNVTVATAAGVTETIATPGFSGVLPSLEFSLGWAF